MSEEKKSGALPPEDYKEPVCPFVSDFYEGGPPVEPIPVGRFIEKLDELLYKKNDIEGARRHLDFWERAAKAGGDTRGLLTVENEMMGFFRQNGTKEEAYAAADTALGLLGELDLTDHVSGATTYLNAATVYKTFGEPTKAVENYEKARGIYEKHLEKNDPRLAGLYNNYALALCDLERFDEAEKMYFSALDIVENDEAQALERAITYLNLADMYFEKLGELDSIDYIEKYLAKAEAVFDSDVEHNGYYAYVCEKSAPTFEYYGWFMAAKTLRERAAEIHDRA